MKSAFIFFLASLLAVSVIGQSSQVIKQRMDSTIYEDYYESKGEWYIDAKEDFIYDEDGNMIESSWYYMENSQWIISNLTEFTYDENGLFTLRVESYWQEGSGQMVTNYKVDYTYNSNGKMTLMLQTIWDPNNNQWEVGYKKEYNYDINENISYTIDYHWEEDTEEWINGDSAIYTYDANGFIELELEYEWDSDNNEWKDNDKIEYTCDDNGNIISRIISFMNNNTNEWSLYSKREYGYDANENPTQEILYNWEESKGFWDEEYKHEYSYNLDYELSDMILPPLFYYIPDNFENISNMAIDYQKYYYAGSWDVQDKASYYYSEQEVTGVSANSEIEINIFPNPASENITIRFGNNLQQVSFSLIDMKGREVLQEEISNNQQVEINELPKGLYFYRISCKNESLINGKIVIK